MDGDGDGFDDGPRSDYDYRYGWSFVACSLAFLVSEVSAVFTITAYFRRLEDRVQYTAVDRKPSLDTPPPSGAGDRTSSSCSAMDGRAESPVGGAAVTTPAATAVAADTVSRSDQSSASAVAAASGRNQCATGGGGGGDQSTSSSPGGAAAESCGNGATSKTPPDICPPKIGSGDGAHASVAAAYSSATLNHPHKHQHHNHLQQQHHQHHQQHYRQTLAVQGGNGSCYEVDTTKPCTCTTAATLTTKRYATIAGVARHNGGKQYTTTTTTALTNCNSGGGGRRTAAGLASIKESAAADHHPLQHNSGHHHRKPEPPTRRLKASVGGYIVPQTPIAALEALDCPPVSDPRLVVPSSV